MTEKLIPAVTSDSLDALHEARLQSDPKFRALWDANAAKRAIAIALVRMRKQRGLTQAELAERADWDKGFVSRLEGAGGPMPDTATLTRYAVACEHAVGVVFASVADGHTRITDAVTLSAPAAAHPFEELKGDELAVPAQELVR
jgi:transcriptional regulator with XRE-family HTH domain